MSSAEHIRQLAESIWKPDSVAMRKILELAMTDDEARFILDLPAASADLAARHGLSEHAIEDKLLGLARRGLVVSSRKGLRFPADPATLHDVILSSEPQFIPAGMPELWMELYEGERWAHDIGNVLSGLPVQALRTIPVRNSVATPLAPHENIPDVIQAHKDLISIRNCCCRVGAKKCAHPVQVCMQFGTRAEYDLYRQSGRKVSADEALSIALTAGNAGLVPTVSNVADVDALDFICFCCGDCCLVINPGLRVGALQKILAPSRFVSTVDPDSCNACGECVQHCCVDAIALDDSVGTAVVDRDKCLGCGACVVACPMEGGLRMDEVRPPDFIPATNPITSILMQM